MTVKEVRLKVEELTSRDEYGRGIARLDSRIIRELGLKQGDVIEVEGKRKTAAIAVSPYPGDVGLAIIRIDGLVRKNSGGVSVGEFVKVRKAEIKDAKKVTLAPAQKGIILHMSPNILRNNLFMRPLLKGDIIVPTSIVSRRGSDEFLESFFGPGFDIMTPFGSFGAETKLAVVKTSPESTVRVTEETEIELKPQAVEIEEVRVPTVTYEDIGGLREEITKVREMIELPLKHPELFERLGVEPPKGILMHGPPGTGKTLLAKAVASEAGAHFLSINGPEIVSKWYGQSEQNLRKIFKEAEENAPAIIFIDEIDAIAPKREEVTGEVERRMVSQLLTLMDGLEARGKVIVIAATNRVNAVDPALRRPGRFDREIEIGVPDKRGRKEILQIHTRNMPLEKEVSVDKVAEGTYGFVGADLAALCKEAAMQVLRRVLPDVQGLEEDKPIPEEILKKLIVMKKDFDKALKMIQPSAMREIMVEVPKVHWSDIGGLEEVKGRLKEAVEWPLKNPDSFKRLGIRPPRGILLYGPPGCGKTLIAKAVATESDANFISIKGPQVLSKWVGESEKMVREVFKKARQVAPCVIFFDEIDSIAPVRGASSDSHVGERIVSQMLTEMSGLEELNDVVVLAATNRPDIIDPALLRPGRFDTQVLIPSPDAESRLKVLEIHTKNMPLESVTLKTLSDKLDGYSGADVEAVCREAALAALRENIGAKTVKTKHFNAALKNVKPSLTKEVVEYYSKLDMQKKAAAAVEQEATRYLG
ncbi:MAG: CDC48 family AAA ATPase [Candidatus Aenigmatarchaeota archaeon]|nr:MAG: CDC48 family AAA ATPase [Candidatus Aenigmarchaeota archaeon]